MPTSPELGSTAGRIWVIEVFVKLEPEHLTETYRHVGVTREIVIDLQSEEHGTYPASHNGHVLKRVEGFSRRKAGVGNKKLFRSAHSKAVDTVVYLEGTRTEEVWQKTSERGCRPCKRQ